MEPIEWQVRVPIFRNRTILKQMGIAIGIPFGVLILFLLFFTEGSEKFYALGLIALLFLLTYLLIQVLYGGDYAAEYRIDNSGVRCATQRDQQKKNRWVNGFAVVLGLIGGKFSAAGAGVLAQSRQNVLIKWRSATKVTYHPQRHEIRLWAGWFEQMAIFCTPENYHEVEAALREKIKT